MLSGSRYFLFTTWKSFVTYYSLAFVFSLNKGAIFFLLWWPNQCFNLLHMVLKHAVYYVIPYLMHWSSISVHKKCICYCDILMPFMIIWNLINQRALNKISWITYHIHNLVFISFVEFEEVEMLRRRHYFGSQSQGIHLY